MMEVPKKADMAEVTQLKNAIAGFLAERLAPKLEKISADKPAEQQALINEYQPEVWIAHAARRVEQIQQVSHPIKFTHPSAEGSSLAAVTAEHALLPEVGSHSLRDGQVLDVVGNAAALDVYKFLRLEVGGKTLLDRAVVHDPALLSAFSEDQTLAAQWCAAFAALSQPKGSLSSHKLAKQVYWPLGAGGYHLLSPLFSSSLAHAVYRQIDADRFSEAAKAAQQARRNGQAHEQGCREYPGLLIQSFGGSKPQNISQLNSERGGRNYLLASLPPRWRSAGIKPPLQTESVFAARSHFARRAEVRRLVGDLRGFLAGVADVKNNMRFRETRHERVAALCDEVLCMAAELHDLVATGVIAAGWSADSRLNRAEACWLDPQRQWVDEAFAQDYRRGDWKDEICQRFANWLNVRLQTRKLIFGAPEAQAWRRMLEHELGMLQEVLGDA